jgi:hypothetical protein
MLPEVQVRLNVNIYRVSVMFMAIIIIMRYLHELNGGTHYGLVTSIRMFQLEN